MQKYLQQTSKEEVKFWINHNLKNYLQNNPENIGEIEHIIDYLNSDKAPTRLRKMAYDEAKINAEKWLKAQAKKGHNIQETDKDIKTVINFENGFKLVKLVGENAFKREGFLMSHCVASYYGKKGMNIFSLRDENNNPHCTIEIVTDGKKHIQQIKGKGNGSIHPNYIGGVLRTLEFFDIEVRESEMSNLGYDYVEDDFFKELMDNFNGIKFIDLKGKKFIYKNSKITRSKQNEPTTNTKKI